METSSNKEDNNNEDTDCTGGGLDNGSIDD